MQFVFIILVWGIVVVVVVVVVVFVVFVVLSLLLSSEIRDKTRTSFLRCDIESRMIIT